MELDQSPNMVSILVFCNHFMKHIMAYVIAAKFLWQGYISIFGAPAKLLSDWGANFKRNIIKELCMLMAHWRLGLLLTMFKPIDKLNKLNKHLHTW